MAEAAPCPFCDREVDSDLVTYGGKCPYCFGEIPGEDAPTDPGEAKKKAEQKAIAAKVQRGRTLPLLLAAMLPIMAVCGALVVVLRPASVMPVLNLDEGEYELGDIGDIVGAPPEAAPVTLPVEAPVTRPGGKIAKVDVPVVDVHAVDFGGRGVPEPGGTTKHGGVPGGPVLVDPTAPLVPRPVGDPLLGGPGMEIKRRDVKGVTLMDDNLIIEMVKQTVKDQLPRLRGQCYEPVLKLEPEVAGSWLVNFTVKADGSVKDASAVAKEGTAPHARLEACIASWVSKWPFQPIKAELPVTKSVGFRPM